MTRTYVFDFAEGDKDQKDLLGGKGANLAEMVKLGLPVPPGFTISTEACRAYLAAGTAPRVWTTRSRRTSRRWRSPAARSWAIRATRCWCRCGRGRSSRCPG